MRPHHTTNAVTYLRDVIEEIGYGELVSKPTEILGDNKAATIWANDSRITVKNRFIHKHYFAVRDILNEGSVSEEPQDNRGRARCPARARARARARGRGRGCERTAAVADGP